MHSVSRSAIEVLSNPIIKHPTVQHIQTLITLINKTFTLCWVPRHIGVPGNEEADTLVRKCISIQPIFLLSLPRCDVKCFLRRSLVPLPNKHLPTECPSHNHQYGTCLVALVLQKCPMFSALLTASFHMLL